MLWSAAVQAHPSRRAHAGQTSEALRGCPIAWSQTPGDVWDTHKRARLACDPDATFSLVVQDDVILGQKFAERLTDLLTERGDGMAYCLFYRHKSRRTHASMIAAAQAGLPEGGFTFPRMQFCAATVIPTAHVPAMVEFCDDLDHRKDRDDMLITRYLRSVGMDVFYPLPSLVDHRPDGSSLVGHGSNRGRQAWMVE